MNFEQPKIVIPRGDEGEVPKESLFEQWETMPLGKAVHTLLHVKEEPLHRAVVKPTQDSPIARALYSIDNYLNSLRFADVYDPLKDQFLKPKSAQAPAALRLALYLLMNSRHRTDFRAFLKTQELQSDEKRRHLGAVLLLEQATDDVIEFIPNLVHMAKQYGDKPVLIACLACDAVLGCSRKALKPKLSSKQESNSGIQIIEESGEDWDGIDSTWGCVQSVFSIMKKWYPFDPIALSAWEELDTFIAGARKAIGDRELYQQINKGWNSASTVITSKNIVSKKPMSSKKQVACLQQDSDSMLQYLNFTAVAILQKSHWLINGDKLLSLEEGDIKKKVCAYLNTLVTQQQPVPFNTCGETIVTQTVLYAPHLVDPERLPGRIIEIVTQAALKQNISLDELPRSVKWSKESLHALLSGVRSSNEYAGDMLMAVAADLEADPYVNGIEFSALIIDGLMTMVAANDLACKVLIRYMDIADLRSLIPRLMKMSYNPDPRTNQVCKALIAKALLAKPWANGDGLLVYVDMVRYFKSMNMFPTIDGYAKNFTSPADIIAHHAQPDTELNESKLGEDVVQKYVPELLSVLQLWPVKAANEGLQNGLSQFVYSSYAAPSDRTIIEAWKYIARGLGTNHPEAIWIVIKHCATVMVDQVKITEELVDQETEESRHEIYVIIMKRLLPLLILRIFSQEAYQIITLPKSIQSQIDWVSVGFDAKQVKWASSDSENHGLSKAMFNELLSRTQEPAEYPESKELAKTLLLHMFCKQ